MLKNAFIAIFAAAAIYFAFTAYPNLQIIKPAHAAAFSTNNTNAVTPSISYYNCHDISTNATALVQARDQDDGKPKAQFEISPKSNSPLQCSNNEVMNGVYFSTQDGNEDASNPKNDKIFLIVRCCAMQIAGVFR